MAGEAVSADQVVLQLTADTAQQDAALRRSADVYDQSMNRIRRAASQTDVEDEAQSRRFIARRLRLQEQIRATATTVEGVSNRVAAANRNLGRQISDIGVGLATGQSPFTILAQQGSQVADAMADGTSKVAKFAMFLSGPLGAALLAAGTIAAVFAGKLFDGGEAASKQEDQLEKLTRALSEYQRLSGEAVSNEYVRIRLLEIGTQRIAAQTVKIREQIAAQLALAVANQTAVASGPTSSVTGGGGGAVIAGANQIRGLQAQLADAEKKVAEARRNASNAAGNRILADQDRNAVGGDSIARSAARVKDAQDRYAVTLNNLSVGLAKGNIKPADFNRLTLAARRRMEAVVNAPALGRADAAADRQAGSAARKAAAAARRAESDRVKAVRDDAAFQADLAKGNDELAQLRADLTTDTRIADELQRQQIEDQRKANAKAIDAKGPGPHGTHQFTAAEVAQLKSVNDLVADAKTQQVNRREAIRAGQEDLDLRTADINSQRSIVSASAALATSSRDRLANALKLLDLDDQLQRAQLEAVLASKASTDVQKQIAQKGLDTLNATSGNRQDAVRQANQGPLAAYASSIPQTAGEMDDALQSVEANGLRKLNDGLTEAITGTKSLGSAFKDVANGIIQDLIRIAIEKAVVGAIGTALGGPIGGSVATAAVGRAGGGFVAAGQIYHVNEHRTEGYASFREPGKVVPLGNMRQGAGTQVQVIAPQQFDLRGVLLTEDVLVQMDARNRAYAKAVARGAGVAAGGATAGRLRQSGQLGT